MNSRATISAILMGLAVCMLSGCSYFRTRSEKPNTRAYDLVQVKNDLTQLNLEESYQPTEAILNYFNFYDLNPQNAQHFFGTIKSEGQTLAAHVFLPREPRGTLFLLHGYFDHTGTLSKFIKEGLDQGYAIAVWDLPGHGLSSGDRTETGNFDLCAEQFMDIVQRAEPHLPRPFHLIGHSSGCSIALEYMYNAETNVFDHIVFLAPLIQHEHWGWAKFGYTIAKPFTKTVRRRNIINSSDEAYLAFVKADPLHSSELSFEYLEDLYAWEDKVQDYPVWEGSISIIQGDHDDVVNWDYNLEFLNSKIQHVDTHMIPGANHQLANENEEIRRKVFELIFQDLN